MVWITVVHTIPPENKDKIIKYCEKAALKDNTFRYSVEEDRIIIESPTRNIAYKRGMLLHYKYNVFFEVYRKNNKTLGCRKI
ncbi:MAG: hypothetical protein QXX41_08915 [Nitrososphaerota archaeon]